jgi:hypothetical protein
LTEFWENAAERLREYLLMAEGTDYGLSDDELQAIAEREIERVRESGRRWSWTVLAADAIRKAQSP